MSLRYILSPGDANELILTEDEIFNHNPVRVHTGLSDLSATIVENRDLDAYVQRQDRLNVEVNGNVVWAGFLISLSHNIGEGRSRLRADGIAKRLKETRPDYDSLGGSLTYSSISLENAIDDYWARTPFDNYSITPQSTEQVAVDSEILAADTTTEFENVTSFTNTDPLSIDNGTLSQAQTLFFGRSDQLGGGPDLVTDPSLTDNNWDDADAWEYDNSSDNTLPVTWSINPDYTIPADNVGVLVRIQGDWPNGIIATLNGDTVYSISSIDAGSEPGWFALASDTSNLSGTFGSLPGDGYTGSDLAANTVHTLEFGANGDPTGGATTSYVDCLVIYDDRFSYTVDNQIDSNLGLEGPELYPPTTTVEFDNRQTTYNIESATVDVTMPDTSNDQQLQLSFNGTTQTKDNAVSFTTSPSDPSRTVAASVRLSRYTTDSVDSPQSGDTGQSIDDITATVDTNTLVVIDELNLSRNHFENLQQLHQYGGDWNWTIEHDDSDIANMTVKSYQQGDETRSKPAAFEDPISESAEVQAEAYFNSIYLQGALDSSGNRPTAEIDDADAIVADGREISPGVLRDPKITTEAGAEFKAQTLLETATSNNELVGTKTLPSDTLVNPGYQYPVDFGNGDVDKTLEEVSLSESPDDVNIRARFSTPRSDLSSQIEDLQRRARDQGDQI